MAYTAVYSTDDLVNIIIDVIGSVGAQLVTFAPIIIVVAIAAGLWARGKGFLHF